MATEDDKINTGALATVVAVGALGMIGVSLAVNALVRHEVGSIGAERDATGEVAYHSVRDAQLKKLSGPSDWTDRAKGQVSVPIDRAMGLVLADLKRSPWNASPAPPPDAGAPAIDPTRPDAGADDAGAGAPPNSGTAATETDAGPAAADGGAAPEPPAGSALSPSAPAPPTSAKPAPAPGPSAAPPKPRAPVAPTAAAPAPTAPAPAAPASPTPPATH